MPNGKNAASSASLSSDAQLLARLGKETMAAVEELAALMESEPLIVPKKDEVFPVLEPAFRDGWSDADVATIMREYCELLPSAMAWDVKDLARWVRAQRGDPESVIHCMGVDPPDEISILRLLSTAGSQKLVFLATWQLAQTEVVVKKFIGEDAANKLLLRELQPHPLSMEHPNIIETHKLQNRKGEPYLVEKRLSQVLNDSWSSNGIHEAANLLRDIASALAYLQDKRLIHGDIKPDNIGNEDGRYILLDFGICRSAESFTPDSTPTGSLRTRAPELLLGTDKHTAKSDVWALGATVFNALVGRFPFFKPNEKPPRISTLPQRSKFEEMLAGRVRDNWNEFVDLQKVPEPIRGVLTGMLSREPVDRPFIAEVGITVEAELAAFLRHSERTNRFSPEEELTQLTMYLPKPETLRLMPDSQKRLLASRVNELKSAKGLADNLRAQAEALCDQLNG